MRRMTISDLVDREVRPEPAERVRTCCPAHVRALPNISLEDMGYVSLLENKEPSQLIRSFQAAPQFSKVPLSKLFQQRRGSLRVIFLTESDYCACQAALYLASLADLERGQLAESKDSNDFWESTGLQSLIDDSEEEKPLQKALTLVSPKLLDPSLRGEEKRQGVAVVRSVGEERVDLSRLDTPAILISAPAGPVLTRQVLQRLDCGEKDLFIALRPEQINLELLEELRFSYGFHVCRIGRPDQEYLCQVLRDTIDDLVNPLGTKKNLDAILSQVDLEQVVAQARRYRGKKFCETDLEQLVMWVIQRGCQLPLKTQDLIFTPFQDTKTGWKELSEMVGMEEVKTSLRRLLAAAALEDRKRERGLCPEPMCRNMAFSGPPGTGKSVTARLAARILREEGRGTGCFVEAGREQLIGAYLGQTSPKVAELFQKARGGVLFIDEAGALLDNSQGQDSYAVEAVNALVRHMELEPETTVIFATYPGEMERLLSSNPGLSSRVAQVLEFNAYDNGALWEIFQGFARKEGYSLPDGAQVVCESFFDGLRRAKQGDFGNGREARRLFQGAVEEMALRVVEAEAEERLTLQDLENAAKRLLTLPQKETNQIGF